MTDPVRPVDPAAPLGDRPHTAAPRSTLPVPVPPPEPPPGGGASTGRGAPRSHRTAADYAAHVLGQDGRRRGLKGGPETLEAARSAYLSAEYSGANDRRPRAGLVKRTDV